MKINPLNPRELEMIAFFLSRNKPQFREAVRVFDTYSEREICNLINKIWALSSVKQEARK